MTSSLAKIPLTYDGEDLQLADMTIWLVIFSGLNESPSVRGKNVVVPYRAGEQERPKRNATLRIELRGMVRSDPTEADGADAEGSWRTNQRTVRALFATNRARAPLVATLEDGSTATIQAEPQSLLWVEYAASEAATVSIVLEGYDDWVVEPAP